jgi:CheY-like chemotaxis protein
LNAILGFGQLLQNADLGAFERDAVDHIVVGGRRLLELVNDVLDISAVRSGRISLSIEPVAVPEVVGEAIRDVRAQASDDGIDVEVRAGRNPTFVLADQQRLRQALSGIVSHAVTFQRVGGLLSIAWDTGPGPTTTITVTDTGAGIDPTQVDHLFAALGERATTSGETKAQLQLPLAKALIEAMGGSISVETDPGRGSVVSVTLRTAEDPRRLLDNLSGTGIDGRAVSILYIDDNLTNLDLVQQILAHRPGTTLLRAVLAEVGIQLAEEHRPDLVLLDLHLPDLTGEEALAKLRSTEKTKDVPVVVLSSEQRQRPSKALRQLGIAGYLSKPLDVGQFLATVDRALAARGRGGA